MTYATSRHPVLLTRALTVIVLVAGLAAILGTPTARADVPSPVTIEFEKSYDPAATAANSTPTWTGTITSGSGGTIEMRLVDYRANGKIEHLVLDFYVDHGGDLTIARMAGTFNNETQQTVLNGSVSSGPYAGSTAHEEGLRIDADTSSFVGWLRLQPGSAG